MKLIKSLLLGTAAGFAATAGVQAADLPSRKAAPVDYVRVCTIGSFTGFVIPGSDTCLKVGGFVRYQATYNEPRYTFPGNGRSANALTQRATASIKFDARTTTEYGLLRSFFDVRVGDGFGGSGSTIDKAYIQFAGLHAGKIQSLFDFYADDASYGSAGLGSDHSAVALGYTFAFGGGFYGVVSLEDPSAVRTSAGATVAPYGGQRWPDLVAAIGVDQAWGSAKLSGAVHHIYTPNFGFGGNSDSEWGYAIQGGVKVNVPSLGAADALWLQAAYADGAVAYLGLPGTSFGSLIGSSYVSAYDFSYNAAGSIKRTTGWNVTAAYEHAWSPTWFSNVFGGYTKYDPSGSFAYNAAGAVAATTRTAEVYQVGANVTWKPVKGLLIGGEVTYFNTRLNAPVAVYTAGATTYFKKSDNVLQGVLRIQRDF